MVGAEIMPRFRRPHRSGQRRSACAVGRLTGISTQVTSCGVAGPHLQNRSVCRQHRSPRRRSSAPDRDDGPSSNRVQYFSVMRHRRSVSDSDVVSMTTTESSLKSEVAPAREQLFLDQVLDAVRGRSACGIGSGLIGIELSAWSWPWRGRRWCSASSSDVSGNVVVRSSTSRRRGLIQRPRDLGAVSLTKTARSSGYSKPRAGAAAHRSRRDSRCPAKASRIAAVHRYACSWRPSRSPAWRW